MSKIWVNSRIKFIYPSIELSKDGKVFDKRFWFISEALWNDILKSLLLYSTLKCIFAKTRKLMPT
jgi:hypothetical protein